MAVPTVNGTVGTASSPGFGNANVTLTKPSGTAVGELLVAVLTNHLGASVTTLSGWTSVYALQNGNVMTSCQVRVVDGSEGSSFTFSISAAGSDRSIGIIFRVGGIDTTTPVNASGTSTQTGDSAADTSPSVTTGVNDCLILSTHHNDGGDITTNTVPSGFTEIASIRHPDAAVCRTKVGTGSLATAGATGTYLWTINGFASDAVLSTVAIAPSGGSPPPPPAVFAPYFYRHLAGGGSM